MILITKNIKTGTVTKFITAYPLTAFCDMNCISYRESNIAHFTSLQLSEDGLVMSNRKGLTLEMT